MDNHSGYEVKVPIDLPPAKDLLNLDFRGEEPYNIWNFNDGEPL